MPVPDGDGRIGRSLLSLGRVVPQLSTKGGSSEQIPNIITYDMALPVSHSMGTQVSVPDFAGWSKGGGGIGNPGDLWICRVRGRGTERANGSRAFGGDGTAEVIDI